MSNKPEASQTPVVGRFAPSPTGPLHLGSLVAAVGSYLLAKRRGGRWLMRMEDLDQPRVVAGMADDILRTLELLGLHWDGEVVWQSRREPYYQAALDRLAALGVVYPCGCSRAEIARLASAPHGDNELPYPGWCRSGLGAGKLPRAFRVRVQDETITFSDGIVGAQCQNLATSCGDFVVKRADGPFAYHLAVVVDDELMGVTQVVRGADLLASTPRQIYLQRLLDFSRPSYSHLPLVAGPGGGSFPSGTTQSPLPKGLTLCEQGGNWWRPHSGFSVRNCLLICTWPLLARSLPGAGRISILPGFPQPVDRLQCMRTMEERCEDSDYQRRRHSGTGHPCACRRTGPAGRSGRGGA